MCPGAVLAHQGTRKRCPYISLSTALSSISDSRQNGCCRCLPICVAPIYVFVSRRVEAEHVRFIARLAQVCVAAILVWHTIADFTHIQETIAQIFCCK